MSDHVTPISNSVTLAKATLPKADLVPQAAGGALRRGNPGNKGGGRPPAWLRQQMRQGLAKALPKIRAAAETRRDPVTGELLTITDWVKCCDFLAKYGLGTSIDSGVGSELPFTVVIGIAATEDNQAQIT